MSITYNFLTTAPKIFWGRIVQSLWIFLIVGAAFVAASVFLHNPEHPTPAFQMTLSLAILSLLFSANLTLICLAMVAGIPSEFKRKAPHLLTGTALFAALWHGHEVALVVVASGVAAYAVILRRNRPLHQMVSLLLFKTGRSASLGEILMPVGCVLALLATVVLAEDPRLVSLHAIAVLTICDALAAIIGQTVRSPSITRFGVTKSLAGSAAFFLSAAGICFFHFAGAGVANPLLATVLVAGTLTAVELASKWGMDNITVPLAAAVLFSVV